jgi:predicted RNase H-like HicB family nuclease
MTELKDLTIHIGELAPGRWVAATGRSPYFCVEADSEAAVKKLAKEAIGFYAGVLKKHDGALPMPKTPFTSKITARELEAA